MLFQNPPYIAFRQLLIPLSCETRECHAFQAWHGYGATNAHRVEVEVGADGPASAPPSGAAAAAPPAGARLARLVRRRRRCGDRFFLLLDAFSSHGALYPRDGPQMSPCFLERLGASTRCILGVA
jgi:hypothetical protein